MANDQKAIQDLKKDMIQVYEMSDLWLPYYFLEIEVCQRKDEIFISQKRHIESILRKFNMASYKCIDSFICK